MSFAPKQNWDAYHSLVNPKQFARERSLSASEKHERYAEIFDHVRAAKGAGEPLRSENQLQEKLALRKKLLIAYRLVTRPDHE